MLFANILIHIELHSEHRPMVQLVVKPLIFFFLLIRQNLFTIYYHKHSAIFVYHYNVANVFFFKFAITQSFIKKINNVIIECLYLHENVMVQQVLLHMVFLGMNKIYVDLIEWLQLCREVHHF